MNSRAQGMIRLDSRVFADSRTGLIYYITSMGGEPFKIATGIHKDESNAIKKALVIANREIKERFEHGPKPKVRKLFGDLCDDMLAEISLEHANGQWSRHTVTGHRTAFNKLTPYFYKHFAEEITKDEWLKYFVWYQEQYPGETFFGVTKYMRKVLLKEFNQGRLKVKPVITNFAAKTERANVKKKKHRVYTHKEILLMDAVCDEDQRLALWLGYTMAFRIGGCVALKWSHIDFTKRIITFIGNEVGAKGRLGLIPISDEAFDLLSLRKRKSTSVYVFPNHNDEDKPRSPQAIRFEEVVRQSGVNYGSHHTLRHTCLSLDFGNPELPDTMVMKIRGVSLQVALEHYIKPTDEIYEAFRNSITRTAKGTVK